MFESKLTEKQKIFWQSVFLGTVLLILLVPNILASVYQKEDPATWIGFWGSFVGGLLGTLGVVFVAYLQNAEQRRLNKAENKQQIKRMEDIEKNERTRLKTTTFITMLQDYRGTLDNFNTQIRVIHEDLSQILYEKEALVTIGQYEIDELSYRRGLLVTLIEETRNNNINFESYLNKILETHNMFNNVGIEIINDPSFDKNILFKDLNFSYKALTEVVNHVGDYKKDIEYIKEHAGYLIENSLDIKNRHGMQKKYIKPYRLLNKWLNDEIRKTDNCIINLLNNL